MRRLNDYDEYGQSIPKRKTLKRLESQRTLIIGYVTQEEFVKMQKDLEKQLKDQTDVLEQLLEAVRAQTLLVTGEDSEKEGE